MSQTILNAAIVLALNANWQATGPRTVRAALSAMCGGTPDSPPALGMNIEYARTDEGWDFSAPVRSEPHPWDEWIKLPIRDFDLSISTPRQLVRVPTVIITPNYSKMPLTKPALCRETIFKRDGGIDQYTGEFVPFEEGNLDHVIARHLGGATSWENIVWTHQKTNSMKANKLPHEAGLRLLRKPKTPAPVPRIATIQPRHKDWAHFLLK